MSYVFRTALVLGADMVPTCKDMDTLFFVMKQPTKHPINHALVDLAKAPRRAAQLGPGGGREIIQWLEPSCDDCAQSQLQWL